MLEYNYQKRHDRSAGKAANRGRTGVQRRTCTIPEKDRLQPWEMDSGKMATDITTRSALQSVNASASIATILTLSEVINSTKLEAWNGPRSDGKLKSASPEEAPDETVLPGPRELRFCCISTGLEELKFLRQYRFRNSESRQGKRNRGGSSRPILGVLKLGEGMKMDCLRGSEVSIAERVRRGKRQGLDHRGRRRRVRRGHLPWQNIKK